MKPVRVILSPDAESVYQRLNSAAPTSKLDQSILNAINKKVELIKANPHYGQPISKDKIPEEWKHEYGINNLFRVELPQFWRMLYTLTNSDSEVEIIAFVLEISNHEKYDKRLGYKRN
ncbi:hypothetical protein AUJ14_04880 [Candidatus Micrarchaeota archaeon CG1_02_55_22]|nr:MAG: hypothetical protein AUJ14_04880 [Candidatus Micrarchaeota archaeon CG1_02_55_22]